MYLRDPSLVLPILLCLAAGACGPKKGSGMPSDMSQNDSPADNPQPSTDPDTMRPAPTNPTIPVPDAAPGCTPILPKSAHDESADSRNACRTGDALTVDGQGAGLDLATDSLLIEFNGHIEAGCLRLDFGKTQNLDPLTIWRRAVPSACESGAACQDPFCGTGDVMDVFAGTSIGNYLYIDSFTVGDTGHYGRQFLNLGRSARYVVICRPSTGPARDDIEIDGVQGGCAN